MYTGHWIWSLGCWHTLAMYCSYLWHRNAVGWRARRNQGCGSAMRFRDCSTQKKMKKNLLSPGHVAARCSSRYKTSQAKHRICVLLTRWNVGPHFWFQYGFLLSVYAPPFLSCPTAWNWTLLLHLWCPCIVAGTASWDIDDQVTAWKFLCPFSEYSVTPRQGTCWETNACADRIDLHLKFVIWHSSATRFCNSQGGMKTLHDEHFG